MKIWKKYIALLLVMMSIVAFAACGSGNEEVQADSGSAPTASQEQAPTEVELGKDVGVVENIQKTDISGTWTLQCDLSESIGAIVKMFAGQNVKLPEAQLYGYLSLTFTPEGEFALKAALDQASADAYLAALDAKTAAIVLNALGGNIDSLTSGTSIAGFYEQEDRKVWLAFDRESLASTSNYLLMTVDQNVMTITKYGGSEMEAIASLVKSFNVELPWTLEKQVAEQAE